MQQPNRKKSAASVQDHLVERMGVVAQLAAVPAAAADLVAMLLLAGGSAACSRALSDQICP